MDIHVLCPFYRKNLLSTLIHYLEPMNIIWHPICDPVDIEPFNSINKPWIKTSLCRKLHQGDQYPYIKFNHFIETEQIIDDDYYGFMGDDDMFEPLFFDNLRKQTAKIIINSAFRGDAIPNDGSIGHGACPLIMRHLHDVRLNNIGTGMYFVKGEILRQTRFDINGTGGDGLYAEGLRARWPNEILFLTNWFIFGNYFQPGRFNRKDVFIKSNWELPKLIQ